MVTLKTALGLEIECTNVIKLAQHSALHVYTGSLTPIQAYEIFGNPEHTNEITVTEIIPGQFTEDNEPVTKTKIYRHYTDIYSVQKSPIPNEILIWLQRDYDDDEE